MEKPRKRLATAKRSETEPALPAQIVRIGFVPEAETNFKALNEKERDGLLRKIKAAVLNPHLAKPLTGKLAGCSRVTYGRIRCIIRIAEGVAVALVLVASQRKGGSPQDAYAKAMGYLTSHGDEAQRLLALHIRAFIAENEKPLADTIGKFLKAQP